MHPILFTQNVRQFKRRISVFILIVLPSLCNAQESFDQLKASYNGNVTWNATTSTVTFTSSGTVNFTNKTSNFRDPYDGAVLQAANWMWNVPTTVQKIIIKKNVTVTGGFHTKGNITIVGEDQNTSVVYGTPLQSWADKNNPTGANLDEWHYCQIQVYGGVCYIQNLKILNPFSFAVRGWGPQIHMKKVSVIDTRGGWGNHSDGFEGGDNSTIDSCYFETGDDNIKVYFKNLIVTNTEIKMVQNSVPIQFGWGNYNENASATFENCKITGTYGRGNDMPIIDNAGSTQRNKTVVMKNCFLENTNGTIFRTAVKVATPSAINVTINNSYVNVKKYESTGYNANGTRTICGTTDKRTFFDCRLKQNQPPQVSFISPSNNATFSAGADVYVKVSATDSDGTVALVKLYLNNMALSRELSSTPFEWGIAGQNNDTRLRKMNPGNYALKTVVYDNSGDSAVSTRSFTVSSVTGIDDSSHKAEASLCYPNPVQDILYLEIPSHWQLFDLQGRNIENGFGTYIPFRTMLSGTFLLKLGDKTVKVFKK